MRVSRSALMAFALLFVGGVCGAGALRAWQHARSYITAPRMSLRDARFARLETVAVRGAKGAVGRESGRGEPHRAR